MKIKCLIIISHAYWYGDCLQDINALVAKSRTDHGLISYHTVDKCDLADIMAHLLQFSS